MSYGGESWAKKIARAHYWRRAAEVMGSDAFLRARYLTLCGPDAGDAKCLVALGVPAHQITAVDTNRDALDSASAFVGPEYVHGDIRDFARKRRGKYDHVFVDLCSTMGPASAKLVAQTGAFAIRETGVIGSGFMYGRESRTTMSWIREWTPGVAAWAGTHDDARLVLATSHDPILEDDDSEESIAAGWARLLDDEPAKAARSLAANKLVRTAAGSVGLSTLCVGQIFYRSTKTRADGSRAGVPMIYTMHMVERMRGRDPAWWYGPKFVNAIHGVADDPDGKQAREMAVGLARAGVLASGDVALLMNLSRQQLAAWLAVDTRERKASAA